MLCEFGFFGTVVAFFSAADRAGFCSLVSGRLACDLGGMFESTPSSPLPSDPEDELLLSSKSIRIGTKNFAAAAARLLPRQRHRMPRANSRNLCFRWRSSEAGRQASAKVRGSQSRPQIAASPKFLQRALSSSLDSSPFCRSGRAAMRCPRVWKRRTRATGPALVGGLPRAGCPLAARPSDFGSEVHGAAVGEGCLHAGLLGVCDAEICEV